ncbi:MAG TPA: DUF2254 family protein [Kofleriaceae bacterium]|nr:DUF2254 family protein [Kofleriaceae bacterium]
MRRAFVRSLFIALAAFTLFFGAELFLEWWRLGRPGSDATDWAGVNNAKLVDLLSPMARAYNNVLAMLLATIGLAIPLTANMHTPKLIDVFLRDRINRVVLSGMAFGAAHVLWVDYIIGPSFAPTWALRLCVYLAIFGWAVLIPYFFYVVRFLDPSRIINRLRDETVAIARSVHDGRRDPIVTQELASQRIDEIGTIVLKSLDRADRGVAREGVWAIKVLLDRYAPLKASMPDAWFPVDRADFVGFSAEALDMLSENRTWFEMKCLLQLSLCYQQALGKASDTVSSISDATRVIATRAAERGDDEVLHLCVRFFNNYLREGIKSRNVHAVYDVYHQYRLLARDVLSRPALVEAIGRHFLYYAEMARMYGLIFAPQLVAYDLGYVVRRAYEGKCGAGSTLLDETLDIPHRKDGDVLTMVVKAKLILGAFFVEIGRPGEAERVRANLADVPASVIARATRDLLAAEVVFFEVTDRQINLEYVPPERRAPLEQFASQLS